MKMKPDELLSRIDHTILIPSATWSTVKLVCDQAIQGGAASVCIPPCYVRPVKDYVSDAVKICTVIGFPNGYNTTAVKCIETAKAVSDGADELDMVINLGMVKEKRYDDVQNEIEQVREVCKDKTLKVIIETCVLTDDEKIALCGVVSRSGANFIKTSTGFSSGGATIEDVSLLKAYVSKTVGVKASGGIRTIEMARALIASGADRIGASAVLPLLLKELETKKEAQ